MLAKMLWLVAALIVVLVLSVYAVSKFIAPKPIQLRGAHVLVIFSVNI